MIGVLCDVKKIQKYFHKGQFLSHSGIVNKLTKII